MQKRIYLKHDINRPSTLRPHLFGGADCILWSVLA